jgi:2-methylisocitrate lyase-like PEP mutase family enzyme
MHDRARRLHELHASGCFVIPNPWDAGSARVLEQMGFAALATTSAGFAWSLGRRDNGVTLEEELAHLSAIASAVTVPVSADFEGGFASSPDDVAANVTAAAATGIAGLSIEDSTGDAARPLYDFDIAVERIRAARAAIDASGSGIVLMARCETYLAGRPDLAHAIERLNAFAAAGADCLYAPGMRDLGEIRTLVEAVAPKPVNVGVFADFATVAQLRDIGVRRISVGGALARTAWTGFLDAAREIAEKGTFTAFGPAVTGVEINKRFGPR